MGTPVSPDDQAPEAVQEARAVVERSKRALAWQTAAIMVVTLAMVLASSYLQTAGAVAGMVLFFGWLAWYGTSQIRHGPEARRATRLLREWDRLQLDGVLGPAVPSPESDPDDPRWASANKLLDRVRTLAGSDPRLASMADGLTERLRSLLGDLDVLAAALETEASLEGEESGSRLRRLKEVTARKEATVTRILETLRDLHVALALRESGDGEAMLRDAEDLVQRLEAEAEVANAGERLPRDPLGAGSGKARTPRPEEVGAHTPSSR